MPRTRPFDLNEPFDIIQENRERGDIKPNNPRKKIYVDPDGTIRVGAGVAPEEEPVLSEVPQEVFAGGARIARDQRIAARKLPRNARPASVDNVPGWTYYVTSQAGDEYELFLYHDGSMYQVLVISPEVNGKYRPDYGHLYGNGEICLNRQHGAHTLEEAYGRSVVWANGFSVFLRKGVFPF